MRVNLGREFESFAMVMADRSVRAARVFDANGWSFRYVPREERRITLKSFNAGDAFLNANADPTTPIHATTHVITLKPYAFSEVIPVPLHRANDVIAQFEARRYAATHASVQREMPKLTPGFCRAYLRMKRKKSKRMSFSSMRSMVRWLWGERVSAVRVTTPAIVVGFDLEGKRVFIADNGPRIETAHIVGEALRQEHPFLWSTMSTAVAFAELHAGMGAFRVGMEGAASAVDDLVRAFGAFRL